MSPRVYQDEMYEDIDDERMIRHCDWCQSHEECYLIPLHGYSEWLCRKCSARAYHIGEAI